MRDIRFWIKELRMLFFWRRIWEFSPSTEDCEMHYSLRFEHRFKKSAYTFFVTVAEFTYANRFSELTKFDDVLANESWMKNVLRRSTSARSGPTVIDKNDKIEKVNGGQWAVGLLDDEG